MQSYEDLESEFDTKVKQLQETCPHHKSTWMEKWWAIGHSCGYSVRVCDNCRKTLEENPTKAERDAEEKKRMEKWKNETKHKMPNMR